MTERLDQIERLQKLREAGALDDEEFLAEKRKILEGATASEPTKTTDANQGRLLALGLLIFAIIGLGLWFGLTTPSRIEAPQAKKSTTVDAQPLPLAISSPDAPPLSESDQLSLAAKSALGVSGSKISNQQGKKYVTRPVKLLRVSSGTILLTTTEIKDGCHACSGWMDLYYLSEKNGEFSVSKRWSKAIIGSGFGAAPNWKISYEYAVDPVVLSEGGYTAQGCTSGGITLTELTSSGPVTSNLVRTSYSNQSGYGDDDGAEINGKITNVRKEFGFEVVYSGSDNFRERWKREGGQFVLVGGETRMPQC